MQNNVVEQFKEFIEFIGVGVIIALIFDFFRAIRKLKKVDTIGVIIQDILFFLITSVIIVVSIIYILDSNIRLYIFLAIGVRNITIYCSIK